MDRVTAVRILGLKDGATPEEIKSAYRKAATQWHPDKHSGDPNAEAMFRLIRDAYEVLQKPPEEAVKPSGVPSWFMDLLDRAADKTNREELAGLLGDTDRADAIQSALRVFMKMSRVKKTAKF